MGPEEFDKIDTYRLNKERVSEELSDEDKERRTIMNRRARLAALENLYLDNIRSGTFRDDKNAFADAFIRVVITDLDSRELPEEAEYIEIQSSISDKIRGTIESIVADDRVSEIEIRSHDDRSTGVMYHIEGGSGAEKYDCTVAVDDSGQVVTTVYEYIPFTFQKTLKDVLAARAERPNLVESLDYQFSGIDFKRIERAIVEGVRAAVEQLRS